jgi:hypothetical protein
MGGATGSGKQSDTTILGYKYSFGIHMGVSRGPVDEIVAINVGGRLAWQGSITENVDITIDNPNLFGGDSSEGGIVGTLSTMMGGALQSACAGLYDMLGGPLPGFRGMCTLFYNGLVCSGNPYPKTWKIRVRRSQSGYDTPIFRPDLATILMGGSPPE